MNIEINVKKDFEQKQFAFVNLKITFDNDIYIQLFDVSVKYENEIKFSIQKNKYQYADKNDGDVVKENFKPIASVSDKIKNEITKALTKEFKKNKENEAVKTNDLNDSDKQSWNDIYKN